MNSIYMKSDETLDFMPDADMESGTWVILGDLVGITKSPITKGRLSTITTRGCFHNVLKHNSANALTLGQKVWLNPSNKKIYNAGAAGYIMVGYALEAATATATSCKILLRPSGEVGTAST